MADGTLVFPKRGEAPQPIQGYVRTSCPYTFKPILPECKHRAVHWRKACGGMRQTINCGLYKQRVYLKDCLVCGDRTCE